MCRAKGKTAQEAFDAAVAQARHEYGHGGYTGTIAEKSITEYWLKYYVGQFCTLCGNSGVIDTRGITTPRGHNVGRLNYCICPNGQVMRHFGANMEEHLARYGRR